MKRKVFIICFVALLLIAGGWVLLAPDREALHALGKTPRFGANLLY